ncbi:hypothetical protein SAMN05720762_10947 [Fibrobacter sp. UWH4]|nr:hypothetical protein SAMN05720762_10947 [Fibrobacter sp. UWH4]
MKLAEVYFVENNAMGAWKDIGYNAPNGFSGSSSQSTNFTYGASTYQATTRGSATWGAYTVRVGPFLLFLGAATPILGIKSYGSVTKMCANCCKICVIIPSWNTFFEKSSPFA